MRQYNLGVWPLQLPLLALGLTAVGLAYRGGPRAGGVVGGILALLWLWTGIAGGTGRLVFDTPLLWTAVGRRPPCNSGCRRTPASRLPLPS